MGIPKGASRATAVHIADTESVVRQGRDDAHPAQLRVPSDGQQGAGVRGNHERVRFPARPTRKLRPVSTLSFQSLPKLIQHLPDPALTYYLDSQESGGQQREHLPVAVLPGDGDQDHRHGVLRPPRIVPSRLLEQAGLHRGDSGHNCGDEPG